MISQENSWIKSKIARFYTNVWEITRAKFNLIQCNYCINMNAFLPLWWLHVKCVKYVECEILPSFKESTLIYLFHAHLTLKETCLIWNKLIWLNILLSYEAIIYCTSFTCSYTFMKVEEWNKELVRARKLDGMFRYITINYGQGVKLLL